MLNNVYVFFNRLSVRFGDVCSFPTDAYAVSRVKPVLEKDGLANDVSLFCVGTVDIETGKLTALDAPRPVDLSFQSSSVPIDDIEKRM